MIDRSFFQHHIYFSELTYFDKYNSFFETTSRIGSYLRSLSTTYSFSLSVFKKKMLIEGVISIKNICTLPTLKVGERKNVLINCT